MQITLQITANSPAEMLKVLEAFDKANAAEVKEEPAPLTPYGEALKAAAVNGSAPKRRGRPPREMTAPRVIPPVEVPAPKLTVVEPPAEEVKEPVKKEITIVEVRNALTQFLAANTALAATALLKEHGHTDRLSQLKREHFEAVYNAAITPVAKDEFDDDIPDLTA